MGASPEECAQCLGHTLYRDAGVQLHPVFPTFLTAAAEFGFDVKFPHPRGGWLRGTLLNASKTQRTACMTVLMFRRVVAGISRVTMKASVHIWEAYRVYYTDSAVLT